MFTLDKAAVSAVAATEGENLVKVPSDISTTLNLAEMNGFAEKFTGAKFEKGTTKADACVVLFDAIAKSVGIAPEAIEAAKAVAAKEVKPAKTAGKGRKTWSKNYILKTGRKPEETDGKKECIWGPHADVITEAITALIAEGKTSATREEIMAKAEAGGLYDRHKSTQKVESIFSWWRKPLFVTGWLDAEEKPEPAPKEAPAAAPQA